MKAPDQLAEKVARRFIAECSCEHTAVAPEGWEGPVKKMKKDDEVDNPFALAWWMKGQGYKPHAKEATASTLVERVVRRFLAETMVKDVGEWFAENVLKSGQKVRIWTGRGKQDYHEGTVIGVKLWPPLADKAFPRDGIHGLVTRKDVYTIRKDREDAYEGEARESLLAIDGSRSGALYARYGKSKERVYKLALL